MPPTDHRAAETLRASLAYGEAQAAKLSALIERSIMPDTINWAKSDLEGLNKRMQAQRDELAKLESR